MVLEKHTLKRCALRLVIAGTYGKNGPDTLASEVGSLQGPPGPHSKQFKPEGPKGCEPPVPLQSPEMGNLGNTIFGTQKGLSGGLSWSHLNNPLGIFNSPFNRDLLIKGRGNQIYPEGYLNGSKKGPPRKSLFGSQKWYFPDFPFRGSVGGRPVRNTGPFRGGGVQRDTTAIHEDICDTCSATCGSATGGPHVCNYVGRTDFSADFYSWSAGFFRAARVRNEIAPENFLNRYEKRFEKREKGSEKRSETRLKNF